VSYGIPQQVGINASQILEENTIVGSDVTNSLLLIPSEERVTLLIYDGIKF
jgi:hypothetical protein